jgi:hypothetical protein
MCAWRKEDCIGLPLTTHRPIDPGWGHFSRLLSGPEPMRDMDRSVEIWYSRYGTIIIIIIIISHITSCYSVIRGCIQKFSDWPPGARTANGTALSATRCSCIAILWVRLVSFAAITLCVASQRVFIVVRAYFVIDSVRKFFGYTVIYFPRHLSDVTCLWDWLVKLIGYWRNCIRVQYLKSRSYSKPYRNEYAIPTRPFLWPQKLMVTQLVKYLLFTRTCFWSLSWPKCIHPTPSHPVSTRSMLILSSHLHLDLQTSSLCSSLSHSCYILCPSHPP